ESPGPILFTWLPSSFALKTVVWNGLRTKTSVAPAALGSRVPRTAIAKPSTNTLRPRPLIAPMLTRQLRVLGVDLLGGAVDVVVAALRGAAVAAGVAVGAAGSRGGAIGATGRASHDHQAAPDHPFQQVPDDRPGRRDQEDDADDVGEEPGRQQQRS